MISALVLGWIDVKSAASGNSSALRLRLTTPQRTSFSSLTMSAGARGFLLLIAGQLLTFIARPLSGFDRYTERGPGNS